MVVRISASKIEELQTLIPRVDEYIYLSTQQWKHGEYRMMTEDDPFWLSMINGSIVAYKSLEGKSLCYVPTHEFSPT